MLLRHNVYLATVAFVSFAVAVVCSASSMPRTKLSDVASAEDLVAEVMVTLQEIERCLMSPESYQASATAGRRYAKQLAVFAQALAEHEHESKLKSLAPGVRDAALRFAQTKSFEDAKAGMQQLNQMIDGTGSSESSLEYDWSKLATLHELMDLMRERAELTRKALRRPKDPMRESRHPAMMAILAMAIDAHADQYRQSSDSPEWHSASLDLQREMTKMSQSIRVGEKDAAIEHFANGYQACDRCHERFKR